MGLQLGKALTRPQGDEASSSPAPSPARPRPRPEGGWWGGIRRWFGAEGWTRPAFAVLALFVVVQNVGLLGGRGAPEEDEVRFRDVPAAPAPARADLVVRWKAGVRMDEADRLLQSISADVVGGPGDPGGNGVWRLRCRSRWMRWRCSRLRRWSSQPGRLGSSGHDTRRGPRACRPSAPSPAAQGEGRHAMRFLQVLLVLWLLACCTLAFATQRALLVGVSELVNQPQALWLQAPRNDVMLMRDALLKQGFAAPDIAVLADGVSGAALPESQAIHDALARLLAQSRAATSCCCISPATAPACATSPSATRSPMGCRRTFSRATCAAHSGATTCSRATCATSTSTRGSSLSWRRTCSSPRCSTPARPTP